MVQLGCIFYINPGTKLDRITEREENLMEPHSILKWPTVNIQMSLITSLLSGYVVSDIFCGDFVNISHSDVAG